MHFKLLQKQSLEKTTESTGDFIFNKTANKFQKTSKTSQQNNSETVTNECDKEIPRKRYMFSKERKKITDDLRLI